MNNNGFFVPPPPQQQYYQQPMQQQIAYDNFGNPITVETPYIQQDTQYTGLGLKFNNIVNSNTPIELDSTKAAGVVKVAKPRKKKDKTETSTTEEGTEVRELSTAEEVIHHVENTDYQNNYYNNVNMLNSAIHQVDKLASNVEGELQKLLSSNIKGKYTYIANMAGALNGILSNKVTAVRELNNITKSINDAEYRRYKDMRSIVSTGDDNKQITDLYNAYINMPVGAVPQGVLPNSLDITAGLNGVVHNNLEQQTNTYAGFINNLSPEQNLMIMEDNPNVEEVIIYDQATGKKYFDWIDNRTGQSVPNLPTTSMAYMEDFTIDPRLRIGKNINMRKNMKVIYVNEDLISEY